MTAIVPAATDVGNPTLNITVFALFVLVTLGIVIKASRRNSTAADYYAGGRAFSGKQNGIAIDNPAGRIGKDGAVAGAIEGHAEPAFLVAHRARQALGMCRAAAEIDVPSIGGVAE